MAVLLVSVDVSSICSAETCTSPLTTSPATGTPKGPPLLAAPSRESVLVGLVSDSSNRLPRPRSPSHRWRDGRIPVRGSQSHPHRREAPWS